MEPSPKSVVTFYSTINGMEKVDDSFVLTISSIWCKIFLRDEPGLFPGDRVKITISKEPDDALPR